MRIVVDNGNYDLHNVGDTAMLQVTSQRLMADPRVSRLDVLTLAADQMKRHGVLGEALDTAGRSLLLQTWNLLGPWRRLSPLGIARTSELENRLRERWSPGSLRRIRRRYRAQGVDCAVLDHFVSVVDQADALVVSGGGFLNDLFKPMASGILGLAEWFIAAGKPVALFGQGLGPVDDPVMKRRLRRVLGHSVAIGLREPTHGIHYLDDVVDGLKGVVTGDDAIVLGLAAARSRRGEGSSVGINLRVVSYANVERETTLGVLKAIDAYAKGQEWKLQPAPISWREGDVGVVAEALEIQPALLDELKEPKTPQEMAEIVGRCRIMFTGSYHAAVFSLSQGIPVVAISQSPYYDSKFEGLVSQFGGGIRIVRPDAIGSLDGVRSVADPLLDEFGSDNKSLLERAAEQVQASERLYGRFLDCLQERIEKR